MHMESVQRYTISMTQEEAKALYEEMGLLTSGLYSDKSELRELYETLEIWFRV